MKVTLLHHSPLWLASNAIRMSHDNHDKSDSVGIFDRFNDGGSDECSVYEAEKLCGYVRTGIKDKELIARVGNKLKHKSVLEQLVYTFDISGVSRALLQELARHRMQSLTVKSTRYTLKELKNEKPFICL